MNRLQEVILLLLLYIFVSCGTTEPNKIDDGRVLLVDKIDLSEWPTDDVLIDTTYIVNNDTLVVEAYYGGGCKEHIFQLIISTVFEKSLPAQANALLAHESNDDMCEAYIHEKLKFDLTTLKDYYVLNYSGNASIVIHLNDYNEPIIYTF